MFSCSFHSQNLIVSNSKFISHNQYKKTQNIIITGTGKTLIAGALAVECCKEGGEKVSFFSHKGPDILDKWVGESERKLRDVFAQVSNIFIQQ